MKVAQRFSAGLFAVMAFWLAMPALGETFSYEVYAMEPGGKRLLSKGQKNYSRADIRITRQVAFFKVMVTKELDLGNGFSVGFSDDGERDVEGLGLWMQLAPAAEKSRADRGFSWEWYNRVNGGVFRKLQGKGTIQVQTQRMKDFEFVTRVEFLEETVFRLDAKNTPTPGGLTHTMVIKPGSILIFPATGD